MKLEEVARRSADAARASVSHLDAPGFDRARGPRRLPLVAGVVGLILVVGVGAWILTNGGSGGTDDGESITAVDNDGGPVERDGTDQPGPVTAVDTAPPRLGLPTLSAWEVVGATELPVAGAAAPPDGWFAYYGDPDADEPYADGDLLIAVVPPQDGVSLEPAPTATSILVRGIEGWLSTGADEGLPANPTLLRWLEPVADGLSLDITLGSTSLAAEELIAIAESLATAQDGGLWVARPGDSPLDLVAEQRGLPFGFGSLGFGSGTGSVVAYQRVGSENPDELLVVSSSTGDFETTSTALAWWASQVNDVDVGGEHARAFTLSFVDPSQPPGLTVLWPPEPGVVAAITSTSTRSVEDLVQLAEAVSPLDDALWAATLDAGSAGEESAQSFDELYGAGGGELKGVEYTWALGLQDGDFCFDFSTPGGASGSCQEGQPSATEPTMGLTVAAGFGEVLAYALIATGPDVEIVREVDGVGSLERVDAGDRTWFVYVGQAGHRPTFEVIVDGQVVDTVRAGLGEAAGGVIFDIADNPSAQALGIADDFHPIVDLAFADGSLLVALDDFEGELCIVTSGSAVAASCLPGDIAVFRVLDVESGPVRIAALRNPGCDTGDPFFPVPGAGGVDGPEVAISAGGFGSQDYLLHVREDTGEELILQWRTELGTDPREFVFDAEVESALDWPADICDAS